MSDDLRIETLGHSTDSSDSVGQVADSLAVSQERTYIGTDMAPSVSNEYGSAHDPLCGQYCDGKPPKCRGGDCTLCDEVDCNCDLIGRVRNEESNRVMALRYQSITNWRQMKDAIAYESALRDAVEVVKAELSALKPILATEYKDLSARDGAQEAENHAIAAIEALGGER